MSIKNDEVFAKFMLKLAHQIVEREDQRKKQREAQDEAMKAELEPMPDDAIAMLHEIATSSVAEAFKLKAVNAFIAASIHPTIPKPENVQVSPRYLGLLTVDEFKVLRAYFDGEDVLTTILSQER